MKQIAIILTGALTLMAVVMQITPAMKPGFHAAIIGATSVAVFLMCLRAEVMRAMAGRALVCAVGLPLLAWSLSNVWLLFAALLLWVPLVARRLGNVAPIYLYSLLLLPGLDETVQLGPVKLFDFGVHDALAIGAAFVIFMHEGKARMRPGIDGPAVAIMLMLAAALARDTTPTHLVRMIVNVVLDLGLPYYIVSRGVRSFDELRGAMLWLGLGGVTLGSLLLYEVWKAWPMYNILYDNYRINIPLLVKERGGVLRAGGPFVEPTSAAMVMATCTLALWLSREMFRKQWHHALVCGVALAGLSAPQSRGAWVGLMLAIAISLAFRGHSARLLRTGVVIGTLGMTLFAAASVSPGISESIGMSGTSSATSIYRRQLFDRGMQEFMHSPIIGYSMPVATMRLADLRQGEGIVDFVNTYIWLLLISGLLGTAIFVGAFAYYMLRVMQDRGAFLYAPDRAVVGAFMVAGLAMPLEMLFFTSFGGRPAFFVFIMFGLAAALLRQRESERAAPPVEAQRVEAVAV